MAKSGVKNKTKLLSCCDTMNTQLKNIENDLKTLSEAINACMNGDAEGPYWNGADALKFYNAAKTNMANNIKDYKTAYERAMALAVAGETKN